MEYALGIKIWLLVVLIGLSAFFSSSETALFSLSKVALEKLRKTRQNSFWYINELLSKPRRTLITILLGNEVVNVSFSVIFASILFEVFERSMHPALFPFLPVIFSWPILVLVGEIIPKTVSVKIPDRMSVLNAQPLHYFSKIVYPLRTVVKAITDVVAKPFLGKRGKQETIIDEDFFKVFIDMGMEEGILDKEERELIEKVFILDDILVTQVMTAYGKISSIPVEISYQRLSDFIKKERYSRIPVYESGDRERIIGILNVKDLLGYIFTSDQEFIGYFRSHIKKPIFIPAQTKIIDALKDFQLRKTHMGIVVSEGNSPVGLVTLEDILEELFGEIKDEYDMEEGLYGKLSDGTYRFDLRLKTGRFCEIMNYYPQRGEYENLLELFSAILGRIPKAGDRFVTEGLSVRIIEEKDRLYACVNQVTDKAN